MKTFAAACLAASATAFDAISVPDFVAGFMFGMTGDNNLTEIEACYQGGDKIVKDSQVAIADFKAGNYFQGIKAAGTVWNEVGSAMTTCKGMDDDVAKIEAWAKIFTEPTKLAETVGKNWVFHHGKIHKDIAQEEADWTAAKFFDAGKDTADALVLAVGPISPSLYEAPANTLPDLKGPIEFLGGLLDGLVEENHLDELTACATGFENLVPEVEELVKDLEAKHMIRAARLAKKIAGEVPTMVKGCKSMGPQVKALEKWATVFEHPKTVVEDIAKSMVFHHKELTQDIADVKSNWAAKKYFNSGKSAADIFFVGIGPVPLPSYTYKMDLMAVPDLAAGFIYGMVGDNNLSEMEACYAATQPLFSYLETALNDLEKFHIVSALKQVEAFVYHFQMDVAPCTKMNDDVVEIENWAKAFEHPTSLVSEASKHFIMHRKQIMADIATVKSDWSSKKYFGTGKTAADLITILVPMQK